MISLPPLMAGVVLGQALAEAMAADLIAEEIVAAVPVEAPAPDTPAVSPPQPSPLAAAVSQAAAGQASLAPLFADLDAVAVAPQTPAAVQAAISPVLAAVLPTDPPPSAEDLRQALQQSGLFLEANLAAGQPPAAGDLKAALVSLAQAVQAWSEAEAGPGVASDAPQVPTPPAPVAIPAGAALAPPAGPPPAAGEAPPVAEEPAPSIAPAASAHATPPPPPDQAPPAPAAASGAAPTPAATSAPAVPPAPSPPDQAPPYSIVAAGAAPTPTPVAADGEPDVMPAAKPAPAIEVQQPPPSAPVRETSARETSAPAAKVGLAPRAAPVGSPPTVSRADPPASPAPSAPAPEPASAPIETVPAPTPASGAQPTPPPAARAPAVAAAPAEPEPVAADPRPVLQPSGVLLEASLAASQASDASEFKAAILGLAQALQAESAPAPTRQPQTTARPAPPVAGGPMRGQAAAPPSLASNASVVQIANRLLAQVSAALDRQTLMQAASASGVRPGEAQAGSPVAQWLFEVPLATPQGTAIAPFEIDRDGSAAGRGRGEPVWRAGFSLDLEPMGPVHARVSLHGEAVRVSLWAESAETSRRLGGAQDELAAALADDGFEPKVQVLPGAPAPVRPVSPGRFTDTAA